MKNIADFQLESKPGKDLVAKYESVLPAQLLQLWQEYGLGTMVDGYLKIVNPDDYAEVLEEAYKSVYKNPVVMFTTGMSDLIVWENNYTILLNLRYGISKVIESGFQYFLEDVYDMDFISEELKGENYFKAKQRLGEIAYDACFGYVPLLGLGGAEKVENLQKVKIKEHISIIAQAMGKIE